MVQNGSKWCKMVINGKNCQKWSKIAKNGQNGLKWSKMVQNGPKWSIWSKMVQNCFKMVQNGEKWSKWSGPGGPLDFYGPYDPFSKKANFKKTTYFPKKTPIFK